MAVAELADVIPLKPYQKNRLIPFTEVRIPEPAKLYCLIGLAFVLHVPAQVGDQCERCGTTWPCDQVRLAFRLREGF